jgi:2-dehydropantoate 2-reductase
MKVCIFGAGAIGSNLAVRLLRSKRHEVSVVTRGAHLEAIRKRGLTLREAGVDHTEHPHAATDNGAALPPQDCVIVTLKAHSMPAVAGDMARLFAPQGFAVFAVNGIPWWWQYGLSGAPSTLPLLDPQGALWSQVRPARVLGCVVDSANEIVEPGVVLNKRANNWVLGEPDGSSSARLAAACELFSLEGAHGRIAADIRYEIWCKLALNVANSPVSALTTLGSNACSEDTDLRLLKQQLMRELVAIAAAHGCDISNRIDVDRATLPVPGIGPGSRPSMAQDVLAGRPMEVEALLGQPLAMAREAGVATPALEMVCALVRGRDRALRAGP